MEHAPISRDTKAPIRAVPRSPHLGHPNRQVVAIEGVAAVDADLRKGIVHGISSRYRRQRRRRGGLDATGIDLGR